MFGCDRMLFWQDHLDVIDSVEVRKVLASVEEALFRIFECYGRWVSPLAMPLYTLTITHSHTHYLLYLLL